jgi:hypothetical protein
VKEIGEVLVDAIHRTSRAREHRLHLPREDEDARSRRLGKASKADGKLSFFNGFDFVIEINWQEWRPLRHAEDRADRSRALALRPRGRRQGREEVGPESHDVEEFGGIVEALGPLEE